MSAHIFGYTILNDVSARDARMIDSDGPIEKLRELVEAEKKGCFIEQNLGQKNTVNHRIKTADGWEGV